MEPVRRPFPRTVCACEEDRASCRTQPAHLLPDDIAPLAQKLIDLGWIHNDLEVLGFLRASPGALVGKFEGGRLRTWRIPTIRPATTDGHRCVFLSKDERCLVHEVAPFGCAYFDVHMSREEGDARSAWGLGYIEGSAPYGLLRTVLADVAVLAAAPDPPTPIDLEPSPPSQI
jgi:Fe-S-cluster containining protein